MDLSRMPIAIGAVLLLTGCLGSDPGARNEAARPDAESSERGTTSNAVVVTREDLATSSGPLLRVLIGRVPAIRVELRPTGGGCPHVAVRGPLIGGGVTNPGVYVDGTRASDTCVLSSIWSSDVQLVEIYPTGSASRSGYATHPHGLILVFTRDS